MSTNDSPFSPLVDGSEVGAIEETGKTTTLCSPPGKTTTLCSPRDEALEEGSMMNQLKVIPHQIPKADPPSLHKLPSRNLGSIGHQVIKKCWKVAVSVGHRLHEENHEEMGVGAGISSETERTYAEVARAISS